MKPVTRRRSAVASAGGPRTLDVDLFSRAAIEDSSALFSQIREAGPVVWLPRHRMWAIGRYADVHAALRDDDRFRSGRGVAANAITNSLGRNTTISSDGEQHKTRRRVLMRSLGARQIAPLRERLDSEAVRVVDEMLARDAFDGPRDFATALPIRIVAALVGVEVRPAVALRWAARAFDTLGPLNRRGLAALPGSVGLLLYTLRLHEDKVRPGSWAASIFQAQRQGEIGRLEAKQMVIDFVVPSLDTTILATSEMLWQLGRSPRVWERIRRDAALIQVAVTEAVRLASPIRLFTRSVARDTEIAGTPLRAGDRVALLYGSANMDERQFPDPTRFDLGRSASNHLAWGNGPHTCVGLHLAKMEMQALLRAMVPRVAKINVWGPTSIQNNTLQGLESFTARFTKTSSANVRRR